MCCLHVVAIGCLNCPNVCSTTFAWDAVYAKVSGLGILYQSRNVGSLGATVSMQPADLSILILLW
jgi:hypothetical protein